MSKSRKLQSRKPAEQTKDALPSVISDTDSSSEQVEQSSARCSVILRSDEFDEDQFLPSADYAVDKDRLDEDGDEDESEEHQSKKVHAKATFDVDTQTVRDSDQAANLNSIFNRAPALVYVRNDNNRRCLRFNDLKHFDQTLYNLQHGLSAETHTLPRTWNDVSSKLQEHGYLSSGEAKSPDVVQWLTSRYERLVDGVDSFFDVATRRDKIWVSRGPPSSDTLPQIEEHEQDFSLEAIGHASKTGDWRSTGVCIDSQPSSEPPHLPSSSPGSSPGPIESIFGPRATTPRLTEDISDETIDVLQDHLSQQLQGGSDSRPSSSSSKYSDREFMEESALMGLMDIVTAQTNLTPLQSSTSTSGLISGLSTPETLVTDASGLFTSPPPLFSPISPLSPSPHMIEFFFKV